MTTQYPLLQAALTYARQGLEVLPCLPKDKAPATAHGVYDATTDLQRIHDAWAKNPYCNVAIRTGTDRNGFMLVVIDVDARNGGKKTIAALTAKYGLLPATAKVKTGSGDGSYHLYYHCPANVKLPSKLGPGVDVKCRNGYVIAPPSIHPATGNLYEWDEQHSWLNGATITALPQWIIVNYSVDAQTDTTTPSAAEPNPIWHDADLINDLQSALSYLSSDEREQWIHIGHALKDLGAAGRELWEEWSKKSSKYKKEAAETAWASFKPKQIGYQTIFWEAQAAGWLNPKRNLPAPAALEIRWPEPAPLPAGLPAVHPFNADLLPIAFRSWVMDIAHRMQCPPDYAAVAAMVAASSLIGARVVVRPKAFDDWQVTPNLWGVVVGRPGVKKSPALSQTMKPLSRMQAVELEQWEKDHAEWELDCKLISMQGEDKEKKAKTLASKDPAAARAMLEPSELPEEPIARRFIVNDATVEKLGELMQQNPWGFLCYRDELYGFLTSLDKQGQEGSRAFYLTCYDGDQGYTFDRIGRGTVQIPRVCLALLGSIQPGRIQEYVRGAVSGGSADDGLLQRFGLAVWPDVVGEFVHIDQWPDSPARNAAQAVFDRLAQLTADSATEPQVWRFTPAAQTLFVEWLVPFETEIRGESLHPAMVSHLAKYRKLIPALALIFALIDTPNSGRLIDVPELMRALQWCTFLRSHAERLYSAASTPEVSGAQTLLKKIQAGALGSEFTLRDVYLKGWTGLNTPESARKAARVLAEYDWLRSVVQESSDVMGRGRPSERYLVNPAALPDGLAG